MKSKLRKPLTSMLLIFCLLAAITPILSVTAAVPALFTNSGFESSVSGGVIPGWSLFGTTGTIEVSADVQFNGSYSLKMTDASSTVNTGALSGNLSVLPGESLVASANVYRFSGGVAEIYLRYYDAAGNFLSQDYTTPPSLPLKQWTSISTSGIVPAGAANARVLIFSSSAAVSTTFIDDVNLSRIVRNPGFEEAVVGGVIPGWSQTFGTGGIAVSTAVKRTGSYSLKITDTNTAGSFGLESNKMVVEAGETYKATAYVNITGGTAELYLRFYDNANVLVGNFNTVISTQSTWTPVAVVGTAPAGATRASVLVYSSSANQTTAYFDDLDLRSALTDLGSQVTAISVNRGAIGKDSAGNDLLYTAVQGSPAKFTVVDIKTNTLLKTITIPGAIVAWAFAVAPDGTVYIGATSNGHVLTYTPGDDTITDLGQAISGENSIWDMEWVPSLNQLYGGTAEKNKVFKYTASGGFVDLGSMVTGESHVRSLAFDASTNLLYTGIGSHAHLIEYNRSTGAKIDILPAAYTDQASVYDLEVVNGKLFAKVEPNYRFVVINPSTRAVVTEFPGASRGVSSLSPIDDKVYYSYLNILHSYDFSSNTTTDLGIDLKGEALNYAYLQLNQPNFPGYTLVGIAGKGKMFKYNLSTGYVEVLDLPLPPQPINIFELGIGPDNNIYSGGYVSGGLGVYNPSTGAENTLIGLGQPEGIATLGSNLYIGKYPKAVIYKYDPAVAWNPAGANPVELFRLNGIEQDRPRAMLGAASENELFIGTAPDYGKLGGALTVYNPVTNTQTSIRNILLNQSIISLAYKGGELFGGGTVWGGIGINPTETSAKVFVYNVAAATKSTELVPVSGKKLVSGLIAGPDGNIWGFADGTLFVLNPSSRTVTYTSNVFPNFSGKLSGATLRTGDDGMIYGTHDGAFFRINPTTKAVTILRDKGDASKLEKDSFGNFYFKNGDNLFKFEVK